MLDATRLAERLLGDAIYANVMMLGAAWQAGLVPLSEAALLRAIEINGASVEGNREAFRVGRWAIAFPQEAAGAIVPRALPRADDLASLVDRRAAHLVAYQGKGLARRYRSRIAAAEKVDPEIATVMARAYHKLLSYKDEYEVSRLHSETLRAAVDARFTDVRAVRFHLAPPFLGGTDASARPRKRVFGPWVLGAMGVLRRFRFLRGTPFDPFGRTAERRMERALVKEYERDMETVLHGLSPGTRDIALELAALPLEIRGFGPVKAQAATAAAARRAELLAAFAAGGRPVRLQAAE